ncbi:hypothetical protein ADICYQ_3472 [Cyclobacterium qasimii M12-11B]|uniref:Uncharacterized protein n=1 Tax=Cyclobacterium qasimii M12-11B TaxID=641524 RepID=S7WTL8_9BACT|nr:hypothetical protein ADICYQ_3472 [Cyclobacterium qasimii M12-11B]
MSILCKGWRMKESKRAKHKDIKTLFANTMANKRRKTKASG